MIIKQDAQSERKDGQLLRVHVHVNKKQMLNKLGRFNGERVAVC